MSTQLPPFVDVRDENGTEIIEGFMPAIVRAVTRWMKLNVTWIREKDDMYGTWNGETYTGLVGQLDRGEVDLIVNPIIPNDHVMRIARFTNPIIYEAFTMLSGKEKKEGGIFLYFSVLQPMVWSAIGITLIAIACASTLLFLRIADDKASNLRALLQYIWVYVTYTLRQAPNEKWMLRKKKSSVSSLMPFLIITWMIGIAFLVMTVFQSLLVSKLSIIKQYPVVDTMEEFVEKKSVKGLTPKEIELQLALLGSPFPIYDKTWEKLEPEMLDGDLVFTDESLDEVQNGKVTIFHGHLILRSYLTDYFKRTGRCNFHLSDNYFFPFPLLMAINKTLPQKFQEKFNLGITGLVDADISGKWFKNIFQTAYLCTSYSETELKPLNLTNIFGVLIIWGVGMILGIISVIVENVYFQSQKDRGKKKRKRTFMRLD